jgi:hypothetical protein
MTRRRLTKESTRPMMAMFLRCVKILPRIEKMMPGRAIRRPMENVKRLEKYVGRLIPGGSCLPRRRIGLLSLLPTSTSPRSSVRVHRFLAWSIANPRYIACKGQITHGKISSSPAPVFLDSPDRSTAPRRIWLSLRPFQINYFNIIVLYQNGRKSKALSGEIYAARKKERGRSLFHHMSLGYKWYGSWSWALGYC